MKPRCEKKKLVRIANGGNLRLIFEFRWSMSGRAEAAVAINRNTKILLQPKNSQARNPERKPKRAWDKNIILLMDWKVFRFR